jgi:hypothetical protein
MFRRLPDIAGDTIAFRLDGQPATGRRGDTVAAALLASGLESCRRTAVGGGARGPFCMMGTCFDCLVTIDDVGNEQGCLVLLRPGMDIRTQDGKREIDR